MNGSAHTGWHCTQQQGANTCKVMSADHGNAAFVKGGEGDASADSSWRQQESGAVQIAVVLQWTVNFAATSPLSFYSSSVKYLSNSKRGLNGWMFKCFTHFTLFLSVHQTWLERAGHPTSCISPQAIRSATSLSPCILQHKQFKCHS